MCPALTPVGGLDLRHAVLVVLDRRFGLPRTVEQILEDLADAGLRPDADRPGKALADAVRWEIRRGRIERAGWGVYRLGRVPDSTMWRARRRMRAAQETSVALRRVDHIG
ncbi:MAG TPA: hypothetical protein VIY72_05725 [Acidimicrobiales bacterium]